MIASRRACRFAGCKRVAYTRDLCATHYKQWQRGGKLAPVQQRGLGLLRIGTLRVTPTCAERLEAAGEGSRTAGARLVLEAWAGGQPLPRARNPPVQNRSSGGVRGRNGRRAKR